MGHDRVCVHAQLEGSPTPNVEQVDYSSHFSARAATLLLLRATPPEALSNSSFLLFF